MCPESGQRGDVRIEFRPSASMPLRLSLNEFRPPDRDLPARHQVRIVAGQAGVQEDLRPPSGVSEADTGACATRNSGR